MTSSLCRRPACRWVRWLAVPCWAGHLVWAGLRTSTVHAQQAFLSVMLVLAKTPCSPMCQVALGTGICPLSTQGCQSHPTALLFNLNRP